MTWELIGKLCAASLVWGFALTSVMDRVVAPTRIGPWSTLCYSFVLGLASSLILWLVTH